MGLIDWFIYGDMDWEAFNVRCRKYAPVLAGALFGAGWWCWADAVIYEVRTPFVRLAASHPSWGSASSVCAHELNIV